MDGRETKVNGMEVGKPPLNQLEASAAQGQAPDRPRRKGKGRAIPAASRNAAAVNADVLRAPTDAMGAPETGADEGDDENRFVDAAEADAPPLTAEERAAAATAPLVLGSASPRRLALLAQIGVTPAEVLPAEIDETPEPLEPPRDYGMRLALEKAEAVCRRRPEALALCADTVVSVGRRILEKPSDVDQARSFLQLLSGRRHRVITAVTLRLGPTGRVWRRRVETSVRFKRLSEAEIEAYLESGEWRGKAGGYAIQGRAGVFAPSINGSYSNVVGLPLTETAGLLEGVGRAPRLGWSAAAEGSA